MDGTSFRKIQGTTMRRVKGRKPRIQKKLNKWAKNFLIETNQFDEDDFEEDASLLFMFSQSECGDEYEECSPYDYINHTAWILASDFSNGTAWGSPMFKVRNPKHTFELNVLDRLHRYPHLIYLIM